MSASSIKGLLFGGGILSEDDLNAINKNAQMQQALALFAASGPSTSPTNLGQILIEGNKVRDAALSQGMESAMAQRKVLADRDQKQQMRNLSSMFTQGETTPERAKQILLAAIETGDPALVEYARKLKDMLVPQFKTQSVQELMVDGKPKKFAVSEDGSMRELGVAPEDLIQVDAGGQKLLVGKSTGKKIAEFGVTMDPYQKAQTSIGYGNLANAQERLRFEREKENRPSYDFMTVDGKLVVGDKRTGQVTGQNVASTKDQLQVKNAAAAISEAASLIPKATGSYVGIARDEAAGAFGVGTSGAEAAAQLDVIAAKLTSAVPRFEGPQGVLDVQLYQKAAADVGNRAKPANVRMAALRTMAELTAKDAELKGIPLPADLQGFISGNMRPKQEANIKQDSTNGWSIKPAGK